MPRSAASTIAILVLALASLPQAQGTAPPSPMMVISRDGSRQVPTTLLSGQELVALDDVATIFQVVVREDTLAGGLTVSYRGRTIVASTDQPMASVNGRVVTLPSPAVRVGRRWYVPVEFLPRALAPIYDQRIDLRRASRLLIVGDVRVPRVTARIDAPGPPTRATIEISPPAPVLASIEAGRVILRIDADALDLALPPGGGGLVEAIRPGDQRNTVAVAVMPAGGLGRTSVTNADEATRVTVEIPSATPAETAAAPRPPAPPPPPPAPVEGLLAGAGRAAFQTVVIDPGHGGDDVGARGGSGKLEEKQLTLDVARRLRAMFETRLGLRVVLTREDDRTVGLDERAAVANNSKADLFLSLHASAGLAPSRAGAEIFYARLEREGEDDGPAPSEPVSLPILGGSNRAIEVIAWDVAQTRHIEASARLAQILDEEFRRHAQMKARGVQQGPMRVLTGANMPAALIELAYLTNPEQARLAADDGFRNALAQALFDAVVRFRSYVEEQRKP